MIKGDSVGENEVEAMDQDLIEKKVKVEELIV